MQPEVLVGSVTGGSTSKCALLVVQQEVLVGSEVCW